MADNSVFIDGVAEGAFAAAYEGLPPWATEKTAELIEAHLRRSLDIQKKTFDALKAAGGPGSRMSSDNIQSVNDELERLARSLSRNNAADDAERRRRASAAEDENKRTSAGLSNWERASKIFGLAASVGQRVIAVNRQYIDTFDGLYRSGINVLNGNDSTITSMQALQNAVKLTGLRLEDIQAAAEKYSQGVNSIGFGKFIKATAEAATQLNGFGFSIKDAPDIVAAYLDAQSNFTNMRRKSEQQIAVEATRFAKNLTSTSQALGISRDQLMAQTKAMAETTDVAVSAAILGPAAAQNAMEAVAGLSATMQSKMMSLVADSSIGLGVRNETVDNMITAGSRYTSQMMQFGKDLPTLSPQELRTRVDGMVNTDGWRQEFARQQLNLKAGVAGAKETLDVMASMQQMSSRLNEATTAQTTANNKTAAATNSFNTELTTLGSQLQAAFAPSVEQINLLAEGIGTLNDGISSVTDYIGSEMLTMVGGVAVVAAFVAAVGTAAASALAFSRSLLISGAGAGARGAGASMGMLGKAGAIGAAGVAGYALGAAVIAPLIDSAIRSTTGDQHATLGTVIYDALNSGKNKEIDAMFAPTPITSSKKPTAVSGPTAVKEAAAAAPTTPIDSSTGLPSSTGTDAPSEKSSINSILTYQTSLLDQQLQSINKLVGVNQEILRRTIP
jgi:hypothetical protein